MKLVNCSELKKIFWKLTREFFTTFFLTTLQFSSTHHHNVFKYLEQHPRLNEFFSPFSNTHNSSPSNTFFDPASSSPWQLFIWQPTDAVINSIWMMVVNICIWTLDVQKKTLKLVRKPAKKKQKNKRVRLLWKIRESENQSPFKVSV